jgi:hypothetical protein
MSSLTTAPPLINDPLLRRLYQYWDRERGGHAMPLRNSVDPIKMCYILGHLALIDVGADRKHFRVRLHGTELVSRLGVDFTGKTVDELPSADLRRLAQTWFDAVVDREAPYHDQVDRVIDGLSRHFEALVLPYSTQRRRVELMVLAIRCRPPHTTRQITEAVG